MSIISPLRVTQLQMELRRNRRREQAIIVALAVFEQQQARHGRRERTVWVKPWLFRRVTLGHYDTLMQELMRESRGDFKAFLRIEPPMFREMVDRLTPRISKHQDCRPGLPAGLRLAITLRFLATGESYHSLAFSFRVSHTTISLLVPEVCRDIIEEYKPEVLAMPTSHEGWREVASHFSR